MLIQHFVHVYSSYVFFILFNFFKRILSKGLFFAVDIYFCIIKTNIGKFGVYWFLWLHDKKYWYDVKTFLRYQGRFSYLFEYETKQQPSNQIV